MKIKDEYILQNIADKWVVIDTDARSVNFNKIISLNESGKFLWETLENGIGRSELISALETRFGIDHQTAENDVDAFIRKLTELECIDYE